LTLFECSVSDFSDNNERPILDSETEHALLDAPMRYSHSRDYDSYYRRRDRYPSMFSLLGISSLGITVLSALLIILLLLIGGVLEATKPGGIDDNSPEAMLLGLALFGIVGLDMLGIGLGIGGLCQRKSSKVLPGLGVAFGIMVIFGVFIIMVIGLATD
jgi:hypothetical protein